MYQFIVLVVALFASVNAQANGVWSAKNPMLYKRSDHTGSVLTFPGNVSRIVIFGGCIGNEGCRDNTCTCDQITNKTTVYNPDADTWAELPEAPVARYRHSAAVVGTTMYVFGGRNLADEIITDVHAFSATTGQWSVATSWPSATSDGSAAVYNNTIYAIGGYASDYDSLATTWTYRPSDASPQWRSGQIANMNVARGDSCAVQVNNKIFIFGGWDSDFCTPLDDVEAYDFATNTWTTQADMISEGGDKGCAALHSEIHIFGGEQKDRAVNCSAISIPLRDVQVFNSDTRTWMVETQMPIARFRFAAVPWSTNSSHDQLIVFGGQGAYNATTLGFPLLNDVGVFADATPSPPPPPAATTGSQFSAAGRASVSIAAVTVLVVLATMLL